MSYLTGEELAALQLSVLDRDCVFGIQGVSSSEFSIARFYGGAKCWGRDFVFMPTTDELIRSDVVKWVEKRRKEKIKQEKDPSCKKQSTLKL